MSRSSAALLSTAATTALVLALAAPVAPASAAGQGKEVLLRFDDTPAERQDGTSGVTVREVTADGGTTTRTTGPAGGGQAVRLPAYRSGTSPKAAFSVTDADGTDDLEPRGRDFKFGADFTLDSTSTGSAEDNGNNLVQRGLYADPAQLKLQVDDRRPSCRLKGKRGGVLLTSQHAVKPGEWYRATCRRTDTEAVLKVVRLSDHVSWTRSVTKQLGSFVYDETTPFSAGAKLKAPARFTGGSADQFNGAVDRVFLDVH